MADLGDEWPHFVCVEAANIRANAITLQPGEQHTMTVIIRTCRRYFTNPAIVAHASR
jgi:D-hexose-6-phosphate mutarotase